MPPLVFADNFLAGSLLSLLMPVLLLIAIAVWYTRTARRLPKDTPSSSPGLPTRSVVESAPEAVQSVEPAGPPPGEIV